MRKRNNLIIIGRRIKDFRKAQGHSQEGFAYEIGLDRSYMGKVERGEQNISIENLIKIAFGLKIEFSELLPKLKQLKKPV